MSRSRFAALDHLPVGYMLARRLAIESRRTFLRLNFLSMVPLFVGAIFFFGVDRALQALQFPVLLSMPWNSQSRTTFTVLAVVMTVLLLSIHELCHGLVFHLLGAKPHYGINLRKAVAFASAENYYVTRDAYLLVALAPLTLITVGVVLGMALTDGLLRFLLALMGTVNAGAAVGDLWFTIECLRQPADAMVRDFGEGAEFYVRSGNQAGHQ